MEATRIKWDESMMTRCLSRLAGTYPQPAAVKKHVPVKAPEVPVKAAESEFTFDFDTSAANPVVNVKPVQKASKWDDFKKAIDNAL